MSFIKTRKVKGVKYYALVEKVKRPNGTWGLKQVYSFGREYPDPDFVEHLKASPENVRDHKIERQRKKQQPMETNRLTEQPVMETNNSTSSVWDDTISKLRKHYGDQ